MLRRPPGHVAPQRSRRFLLAFALFILPWLPLADAQQQHTRENQLRSPPEADHAASSNIAATPLTGQKIVETPRIHDRRKTTVSRDVDNAQHRPYDAIINPDDASAAHALDLSVRAPPPSLYKADYNGVGGLSQQIARSLEDWEVKDFVLLATVDGDLYASDRKTGQERWHFKADHPMVETRHFRANRSVVEEDYDPIDHYLWVIEPARDGELYMWRPTDDGVGLAKLTWNMKDLMGGLSPHFDRENGIVYTGKKETTMVTLNADTGAVIKEFSSSGSYVNKVESDRCYRPNALADGDSEECRNSGTITIGRTEYNVGIHRIEDGSPIASLKYSEWGPNTLDNDLIRQNILTKDSCYVSGQHDGLVYGFDYERFSEKHPIFKKKLSSPVARVFDVLHRWDSGDSDLIVLPQPPIPPSNEDNLRLRNEKVFLNQTEEGSWYALSGARYPLIVEADAAKIYSADWWDSFEGSLNGPHLSEVLVGTHKLPDGRGTPRNYKKGPLRTLDPPEENPDELYSGGNDTPLLPAPKEPITVVYAAKQLGLFDLLYNPMARVIIAITMLIYSRDIIRRVKHWSKGGLKGNKGITQAELTPTEPSPVPTPEPSDKVEVTTPTAGQPDPQQGAESANKAGSPTVTFAEPPPEEGPGGEIDAPDTPKAKKKAHRGRRGGVKHKKGANGIKREPSQSLDDDPEITVEEAVNKAKQLGARPELEPDIITVPNGVEEVSGPILKMGSLEVNEEQQLGIGSNGTIVFAGKWDGRDVAVKRMLIQFNDIASRETKLLRESDDHANGESPHYFIYPVSYFCTHQITSQTADTTLVIRYYAQQQRAGFLYIALELCQASLADVISKPNQFRELAQAGERNLPDVLYQITSGLCHLHDLRIVHRDLKPQNILVNMSKNGYPRLLVSDFGLCKKLDGGQSSFGATTAHAAGTSGWRAPELLLDDDAPGAPSSMTLTDPGSSLPSGSGMGLTGPNSRRVTRAIDIFSLGLVFFYVLTKGNHPFDCGDRYMREVNIRKGAYNLDLLEALGDFAFEARDLIGSMLNANPKDRPPVREVMSHPFFWDAKKRLTFLCDVSDHFEKEVRDPPSGPLQRLESSASKVIRGGDFMKVLPRDFVDSLGKQRKYTGGRMLDLLRALRNKRNHYEDMSESLQKTVGPLPDGYLGFWSRRFPNLLVECWNVVYDLRLEETSRFRDYYLPARPELI